MKTINKKYILTATGKVLYRQIFSSVEDGLDNFIKLYEKDQLFEIKYINCTKIRSSSDYALHVVIRHKVQQDNEFTREYEFTKLIDNISEINVENIIPNVIREFTASSLPWAHKLTPSASKQLSDKLQTFLGMRK